MDFRQVKPRCVSSRGRGKTAGGAFPVRRRGGEQRGARRRTLTLTLTQDDVSALLHQHRRVKPSRGGAGRVVFWHSGGAVGGGAGCECGGGKTAGGAFPVRRRGREQRGGRRRRIGRGSSPVRNIVRSFVRYSVRFGIQKSATPFGPSGMVVDERGCTPHDRVSLRGHTTSCFPAAPGVLFWGLPVRRRGGEQRGARRTAAAALTQRRADAAQNALQALVRRGDRERACGVGAAAALAVRVAGATSWRSGREVLPLPVCRDRFQFQSNLVWNSTKPVSNLYFFNPYNKLTREVERPLPLNQPPMRPGESTPFAPR